MFTSSNSVVEDVFRYLNKVKVQVLFSQPVLSLNLSHMKTFTLASVCDTLVKKNKNVILSDRRPVFISHVKQKVNTNVFM